jgi:hypothetical protein
MLIIWPGLNIGRTAPTRLNQTCDQLSGTPNASGYRLATYCQKCDHNFEVEVPRLFPSIRTTISVRSFFAADTSAQLSHLAKHSSCQAHKKPSILLDKLRRSFCVVTCQPTGAKSLKMMQRRTNSLYDQNGCRGTASLHLSGLHVDREICP